MGVVFSQNKTQKYLYRSNKLCCHKRLIAIPYHPPRCPHLFSLLPQKWPADSTFRILCSSLEFFANIHPSWEIINTRIYTSHFLKQAASKSDQEVTSADLFAPTLRGTSNCVKKSYFRLLMGTKTRPNLGTWLKCLSRCLSYAL